MLAEFFVLDSKGSKSCQFSSSCYLNSATASQYVLVWLHLLGIYHYDRALPAEGLIFVRLQAIKIATPTQ